MMISFSLVMVDKSLLQFGKAVIEITYSTLSQNLHTFNKFTGKKGELTKIPESIQLCLTLHDPDRELSGLYPVFPLVFVAYK